MSERLLQISELHGVQPSTELVPLDYGRFIFNTLHGTELEAHKSNLTAEQAKAINDHFDIELYFGKHGTAAGDLVPWREVPTQRDYDAAAKVVEDLQPGDMLFLEAPGFTNPVLMPTPDPQHKAGVSRPGVQTRPDYSSVQNYIASMAGPSSALSPLRRYRKDVQGISFRDRLRNDLERQRAAYRVDAFSYAAQLANLKGIPVIHADMDAFEVAQLRAAHGGKDFSRLLGGTVEEKIKFISAQPLRERQSRNILKDVALDRLAAGDLPPDRKPKLRVLFGAYHKDGILESYSKMKLQVKAVDMDKSSAQEAAEEHNKNMRRNSGAGRVALRGIGANQHSFSGLSARRAIMEKLKEKRGREGG